MLATFFIFVIVYFLGYSAGYSKLTKRLCRVFLRKIQTVLSCAFFLAILSYCIAYSKHELTQVQLSYWGVEEIIGLIWNSTLMIMAISMHYNLAQFLLKKRMYKAKALYWCFSFVYFTLFISGLVTMEYKIHTVAAYLYFFSYPFSIFLLYWFNRSKMSLYERRGHLLFIFAMILTPIILLFPFKGMAISEIGHSLVVVMWSLWILRD